MNGEDRGEILARFPRERTWLLPALHAIQHEERWISTEALADVADHLRVPRSEAYAVATHYPEFRLARPGRRVVRVCVGVPCRIRGSLGLLADLERRLGVTADGTTPDGELTLERLDCGFNCSMAPVVEVDGRLVGRVGTPLPDQIMDALPHPDGKAHDGDEQAPEAAPSPGFITFPTPTPSPIPPSREPPVSAPTGGPARWFMAVQRAAQALAPPASELRLTVEVGSCSLSVGAAATLAALAEETGRRGLRAHVVATGCSGLCWAAPVVTVAAPGRPIAVATRVTADRVTSLVADVAAGRVATPADVHAFLTPQRRALLDRCGVTDPRDTADAIRRGAYAALARALADGRPETVIDTVTSARLLGRGGTYSEAAAKWEGARRAPGWPKYLVVNGEEGEPGLFKDRHLMEGDPHRLIEGALLAAYAADCRVIYLHVHGEAHLSARRLTRAVEEARSWGLVSQHVLGSDFSVEIEVRRGAGGFVLGEETALMESIEGRRAVPRAQPPVPAESGLWGRPTVVHNVETLFALPLIVGSGADWWPRLGAGFGTKCFGLAGHVKRPGVVETAMGVTLRTLIEEIGGGMLGATGLKGVLVGGPSGILVPPAQIDEPLQPTGVVPPGRGGIVALDATVSIVDVVRSLLDFNARESCGKCTPCREGTGRLRDMLDAPARASSAAVTELAEAVRLGSICGLGQAAPRSLLSAYRAFPEDVGLRSSGRTRPAGG
jgi:NADH:ubiquinone oxidoreductase subunit F (NADH-binding)/NADH:ubiquinone oxidoreductase subunit E